MTDIQLYISPFISLGQSVLRINPGQPQNNQNFQGSLISVRSIQKGNQHAGTS